MQADGITPAPAGQCRPQATLGQVRVALGRQVQRLRQHRQAFSQAVFVQQRQAVEVQRGVIAAGFVQQVECGVQRVGQVGAQFVSLWGGLLPALRRVAVQG